MIALPTQYVYRAAKKSYGADEVRAAISSGKLLNYYQSKVNIATRYVVGVETLVRWFHPQDGMVYPDQFIGVAETHGLINDLTRVVLTNALVQAKVWQEAGLTLQVAVNLSERNLASPDFADLVVECSTRVGVPPRLVELEVAEHCLTEELRTPFEVLTRLHQNQFRISVNDFDIENSSLVRLSDLPIDEIKIKPRFVHDAWNNEKLQAKFESTTALAKIIGKNVVAVGVENSADSDFVRKTKCNISQGHFISKPMPGPNLPGWIRAWHSTEQTPSPSSDQTH